MAIVWADRVQLQQVLLNLIVNACDAMNNRPPNERPLIISTARNGDARIEMRDQGTGIPPDVLISIFDPFVTTKRDGLGLGLAICRTIITEHHGRMWAVNNPDRGATMIVSPTARSRHGSYARRCCLRLWREDYTVGMAAMHNLCVPSPRRTCQSACRQNQRSRRSQSYRTIRPRSEIEASARSTPARTSAVLLVACRVADPHLDHRDARAREALSWPWPMLAPPHLGPVVPGLHQGTVARRYRGAVLSDPCRRRRGVATRRAPVRLQWHPL